MTATATLRAWHGDAAFKQQFLDILEQHRQADQIIQGTYAAYKGEQFRGCAIGCALHTLDVMAGRKADDARDNYGDHAALAAALEIPESLTHLEDGIFEGLPAEQARVWPGQFAAAIPVGADLTMVAPRFLLDLLRAEDGAVQMAAKGYADVENAVEGVAALYAEWIETGVKPTMERFDEAAGAAGAAEAARAAEAAGAARAAEAAGAAEAARAAEAAGAARAARAAGAAERARQAAVLLSLLASAPSL